MDRGLDGTRRRACGGPTLALLALLLWPAAAPLFSGCAFIPRTGADRALTAEEELRETLLADARYHVKNVPPDFPPQRAASFRVAAQGVLAWEQGRVQEAEDRLERAITLDPRNAFGYFYLAEIRVQEGKFLQALVFLSQAELLFQGHPHWLSEVYATRGRCHEELGNGEEAARAYARALEYNPWNEAAQEGLARVGHPRG